MLLYKDFGMNILLAKEEAMSIEFGFAVYPGAEGQGSLDEIFDEGHPRKGVNVIKVARTGLKYYGFNTMAADVLEVETDGLFSELLGGDDSNQRWLQISSVMEHVRNLRGMLPRLSVHEVVKKGDSNV